MTTLCQLSDILMTDATKPERLRPLHMHMHYGEDRCGEQRQ